MNPLTLHLRIGDPVALVRAFVGHGVGFTECEDYKRTAYHRAYSKTPERREYHRDFMRRRRAAFHAAGLNSQGKPPKRRANRARGK